MDHEDQDYECEWTVPATTSCPFKGLILVKKVVIEREFSSKEKAYLANLTSLGFLKLSDEFIDEILRDTEVALEYDHFCSYTISGGPLQSKTQKSAEKHLAKIYHIVHKLAAVEMLKMKHFIRLKIPENEPLVEAVLARPEVLESMRIILNNDGDKTSYFEIINDAIETEMGKKKPEK